MSKLMSAKPNLTVANIARMPQNWKGKLPKGITAVVRSSTNLAFAIPRIQMDDTTEDKKAIQAPLSKVMFYPLSQFNGKMKTTDWSKIPSVPVPAGPPNKWVNPETYLEQVARSAEAGAAAAGRGSSVRSNQRGVRGRCKRPGNQAGTG